jgi:hypothetical protein
MKLLSLFVILWLAFTGTSEVFACSPSHELTEFTYDVSAVALDEKNRLRIAKSLAQVTEPRAAIEWVELTVWRNIKSVDNSFKKLEEEKSQARAEYLQQFFVRLGTPIKVHVHVRNPEMMPERSDAALFKTSPKKIEAAEISIVHFKPCQCRINIPMPPPDGCPRF